MSWYKFFFISYRDYPFNFLNWFLHPRLTNDLSLEDGINELLLSVGCSLHRMGWSHQTLHNTPKLSSSIYDPAPPFAAAYRYPDENTLASAVISLPGEHTLNQRAPVVFLSGNLSPLTRHNMWSCTHLGMWTMSHTLPRKISSFFHLHDNYRCLWISLRHQLCFCFLQSHLSHLADLLMVFDVVSLAHEE